MAIINIPGVLPLDGDLRQTVPIGVSPLGTPIFDDITFPAGEYTNLEGEVVQYSGLSLQSGRLVVAQRMERVKTPVEGRNGTIKESVALGDLEIRIETEVTELFNVFPYDQLIAWRNIKNSPESVPVISKWLNDVYEVENIVIEDFQFNTIPGSINQVELTIIALSDLPFNVADFSLNESSTGETVEDIFLFT